MPAVVTGLLAGLVAFAGLLGLGYVLSQRVFGDSLPGLVGTIIVFGAIGAYGGWLLALVVFSAVRTALERSAAADAAESQSDPKPKDR